MVVVQEIVAQAWHYEIRVRSRIPNLIQIMLD